MNDLFSQDVRKYIPPAEYEALVGGQRNYTCIGLDLTGYGGIERRIAELEDLENKFGFVYYAEKLWLKDYLKKEGEDICHYALWLTKMFQEVWGVSFTYLNPGSHFTYGILPQSHWRVLLESPASFLPTFSEIKNPAFERPEEIRDLEVIILGDKEAFYPMYLIKAFEFLFDLPYIIAVLPNDPRGYAPVGITGLEVCNPENVMWWELNVVSEYGAVFNYTLLQRKPWRSSPSQ